MGRKDNEEVGTHLGVKDVQVLVPSDSPRNGRLPESDAVRVEDCIERADCLLSAMDERGDESALAREEETHFGCRTSR